MILVKFLLSIVLRSVNFHASSLLFGKPFLLNRANSLFLNSFSCTESPLIFSTLTLSYLFLPKLEYLPEGNRNLIFGIMLPPPGYNLKTLTNIAESVEGKVKHLWSSISGEEAEAGQPPKIKNYLTRY